VALAVKFPVVDDRIVVAADGMLGPRERASAFASIVRADIARIDAANARLAGARLPHKTYVDGAEVASLAAATQRSEIVARWELGVAAVAFVLDILREAGPAKTGAYRASARLYVDGRGAQSAEEAAGAREALILSTVPYARKIERGRNGYAPGKVYEAAAQAARARFGNVARIKFTYAEPEGPAPGLDAWAAAHARRAFTHPRRQASQAAKNRRQPAILILFG
jgi:hypothetical protein